MAALTCSKGIFIGWLKINMNCVWISSWCIGTRIVNLSGTIVAFKLPASDLWPLVVAWCVSLLMCTSCIQNLVLSTKLSWIAACREDMSRCSSCNLLLSQMYVIICFVYISFSCCWARYTSAALDTSCAQIFVKWISKHQCFIRTPPTNDLTSLPLSHIHLILLHQKRKTRLHSQRAPR